MINLSLSSHARIVLSLPAFVRVLHLERFLFSLLVDLEVNGLSLKQLPSGLLLVTGPYKINGVPLRRVNQSYVIATSTKIDVSGVDVSKINDDFFKKPDEQKPKKKTGPDFFEESSKKKEVKPERITEQKRVDALVLPKVMDKQLKAYLGAKFSLTKGQFPHNLKF